MDALAFVANSQPTAKLTPPNKTSKKRARSLSPKAKEVITPLVSPGQSTRALLKTNLLKTNAGDLCSQRLKGFPNMPSISTVNTQKNFSNIPPLQLPNNFQVNVPEQVTAGVNGAAQRAVALSMAQQLEYMQSVVALSVQQKQYQQLFTVLQNKAKEDKHLKEDDTSKSTNFPQLEADHLQKQIYEAEAQLQMLKNNRKRIKISTPLQAQILKQQQIKNNQEQHIRQQMYQKNLRQLQKLQTLRQQLLLYKIGNQTSQPTQPTQTQKPAEFFQPQLQSQQQFQSPLQITTNNTLPPSMADVMVQQGTLNKSFATTKQEQQLLEILLFNSKAPLYQQYQLYQQQLQQQLQQRQQQQYQQQYQQK